jgi:hypothetical protein
MTEKLKLGSLADDKPVKLNVELPAALFADLTLYAQLMTREAGGATPIEPARLVAPMLARFIATDRVFAKRRRDAGASAA